MPVEVNSYLIRLWRETDATTDPTPEWQSEVEHLQSGQRWSFETTAALLAFMAVRAATPQNKEKIHG